MVLKLFHSQGNPPHGPVDGVDEGEEGAAGAKAGGYTKNPPISVSD